LLEKDLLVGDLSGNNLQDFCHSKAKHMGLTEAEYHNKVVSEFEQIINAPEDSEFNLWSSMIYSAR